MEADSFGVSPNDVRNASGAYEYTGMSKAYEQAGMDPLAWVAPMFSGGQGGGGGRSASPMPLPQAEKPKDAANQMLNADAEFYANDVQDYGMADSLIKSKNGVGVFQMGENIEFDDAYDPNRKAASKVAYSIVPHGNRVITLPNGRKVNVAVKDLAANRVVNGVRMPVRTVGFRGGDEAAGKFREQVVTAQSILSSLSKIEELYQKNTVLTSWGWSEDGSMARGLENKVVLEFSKFLTDAKGLGAGVSNEDTKILKDMAPQRANATFGRFGGNEMALLKQMRSIIKDKVRSIANVNGLELSPVGQSKPKASLDQRFEMASKTIR